MKIALVTSWKVRCGIATYSENLANALAKQDVEVYVMRLPRFGLKTAEIVQNVALRVPKDAELIHVQHEYGLFQGFDAPFYTQLKACGKPIITTMHAVGLWEIDGLVSSMSARVIVHNKFCQKRFSYPSLIIPHGATPTEPMPTVEAKKSWGIDPRAPLVGYLGFISNYKGLETIIEAMMKVKGAGLLMAGGWFTEQDTEYMNKLKEWTLQILPARCQWIGFVPDDKLVNAYGAMDILIYPSRYSTESGALVTALSYGKAVIASRLPPFIEKEKEGALVTFKDVNDLRRKIKYLLNNSEARAKLEEGARRYAKAVEWSEIAKKHISLYEDVLKG